MVNVDQYTIEDIQKMIIDVCNTEYYSISSDDSKYFLVENDTVENVRSNILNHLSDPNLRKSKYLDMTVYIMQMNKDVFISIT